MTTPSPASPPPGDAAPALVPGVGGRRDHRVAPAPRQRTADMVVAAVRRHGPATRGELERATGLSRATLAATATRLIADGILRELPADAEGPAPGGGTRAAGGTPGTGGVAAGRGRGRPPARLALTEAAGVVVGLAFGHSDLRAAAATLSGEVLAERYLRLAVDNSAPDALDAAAAEFDRLLADTPTSTALRGVVVGLPSPLDRRSGRVGSNNILPGWTDLDVTRELRRRLGRPAVPVYAENAANLGALGEQSYGAGAGVRDLVFIKVSTGIGAGLILDGRLYRGATGLAGELGHVQIEPNGLLCRCGSRGCLETLVAIPHIIAALQPMHPAPLAIADLVGLLAAGDSGALRVVGDAGRTIGESLADVCNVLNPELVVVGGELSLAAEALTAGIREAVARYAQPSVARVVRVVPGALAERAELLGALALGAALDTPVPA